MSRRGSSVKGRLTLWYSAVLAGIVCLLSLFVFFFVRASLVGHLNRRLEADFTVIAQDLTEDPDENPEVESENAARIFQVVRDERLRFETASYTKSGLPLFTKTTPAGGRSFRTNAGRHFRMKTASAGPGVLLTLALDEEPLRNSLRTLAIILAFGLPLGLVLAGLGGYLMAGRLLRPVETIAHRAAGISADSLSARLPVENPNDEFGRLAAVINATLRRLEDAFDRLKRFTADASHELRTPLTVIRSVGEVALQEDLDAAAYRDRIGSMLEEVDRLTRLVDSLLVLTRSDGGHVVLARHEIDVTRLVGQAVEDLRVLAEEKEQSLVLEKAGPAVCRVDEATLRLALVNLLDNAIKYTPRGGAVTVTSGEKGTDCIVEIRDTGPGISPKHEDRIFDRFYRIPKNRSGVPEGAGLGLSIAKWAVEANGGRIELESREGQGSVFRIILPRGRQIVPKRRSG